MGSFPCGLWSGDLVTLQMGSEPSRGSLGGGSSPVSQRDTSCLWWPPAAWWPAWGAGPAWCGGLAEPPADTLYQAHREWPIVMGGV